jgi:hypothetical protein
MNGTIKHFVFGTLAAIIIGLCGWTLKSVKDLSINVARIEQDEIWIKAILTEQSRKLHNGTERPGNQ